MILFFDTETTGFLGSRLVQLGALLCEDDGTELSSIDCIIRPDGFVIPENVSKIHGISTEMALRLGVDLRETMLKLASMVEVADLCVAHNYAFDSNILNGEFVRLDLETLIPEKGATKSYCTMLASTDICRLPQNKKGWRGYKWPKLIEAYMHFFNETFDGAHSAMPDVKACKRIYFHMNPRRSSDDVLVPTPNTTPNRIVDITQLLLHETNIPNKEFTPIKRSQEEL